MPRVPSLVLVTDRQATGGRDLIDVVAAALDAGLPAVQLREKDLPGGPLLALAERLRALTARTGALLLVNDRLDVAADADGVHLGGGSVPVDVARQLLPAGAVVGVSTHAPAEAADTSADFAVFGPVYATPSKTAYGPPQGEARFRAAAATARVPLLAIGGVTAAQISALRAAGAAGVAVIRTILAAENPARAARAMLAALA